MDIDDFLSRLLLWVRSEPDVGAVALVGSHARNQARADSDIDIVLLVSDKQSFLEDTSWVKAMGRPLRQAVEEFAKVMSLRVWYAEGYEVEYCLAASDWGADPADEGDWRVISDGFRVLHEGTVELAERVRQFQRRWA